MGCGVAPQRAVNVAYVAFCAVALFLTVSAVPPLSDMTPHDSEEGDTQYIRCLHFNRSACAAGDYRACGKDYVICEGGGGQMPAVCMTLARNGTVEIQSCWHGNSPECFRSDCVGRVEEGAANPYMFCCCDVSECNRNYRYEYLPKTTPTTDGAASASAAASDPSAASSGYSLTTNVAICVCVGGAVSIAGVIGIACWVSRKNHSEALLAYQKSRGQKPGAEEPVNDDLPPLQYCERVAVGRYGSVWKASVSAEKVAPPFYGDFVAVKVFEVQNRSSYLTECDMYRLPGMQHDNLLSFFGAEQRGEGLDMSLRIVTEYCSNGSIYDYLKGHTLTWRDALRIAHGFARGLAFLHEEGSQTSGGGPVKPTIAHRDVKSRNVLLRGNLTPCVADLGLALRFEPGRGGFTADVAHGQVGTTRYMAPEVLDGAINFTRDAFLRIDIYACGLVLWELLSRTELGQDADGAPAVVPDNYEMPFAREVGAHPSLEEMQDAVFVRKLRPALLPAWRRHRDVDALCDAIEDCWDQDAEARLSASCIQERMRCLLASCDRAGGSGDSQQALMNKLNAERGGSCIAAQPPMAFIDEGLPLLPRGDGDCSTASA